MTKPVQERIGKLVGSNSRRTDVQIFDPSTAVNPARLTEYVNSQREEMFALLWCRSAAGARTGIGRPIFQNTMPEAILTLKDVHKNFASHTAVDRLSLAVNEGELFTLLGPSGCGKSTTLRMIAGLEDADSGEIWLRDQLLSAPLQKQFIAPQRRQMGMVFQSYAVWPHLSVFENSVSSSPARRIEMLYSGTGVAHSQSRWA